MDYSMNMTTSGILTFHICTLPSACQPRPSISTAPHSTEDAEPGRDRRIGKRRPVSIQLAYHAPMAPSATVDRPPLSRQLLSLTGMRGGARAVFGRPRSEGDSKPVKGEAQSPTGSPSCEGWFMPPLTVAVLSSCMTAGLVIDASEILQDALFSPLSAAQTSCCLFLGALPACTSHLTLVYSRGREPPSESTPERTGL